MKVGIIGGGITGLSLAYFLGQRGHETVVFEKEEQIGGIAGSIELNGAFIEKYYHHSFQGHSALFNLCRALNIDERLISQPAKTGFYYDGKIYPFGSGKDLLSFKPLNLCQRLRLGISSLLMMGLNDWRKIEKTGALEWLQKYSGKQASNIVWEPLLKSKFGDDFEKISAAWLWNRVVDRKGGKSKEQLGYLEGGYSVLLDALAAHITKDKGEILKNARVKQVIVEDGQKRILFNDEQSVTVDIVISTIPIPFFLNLFAELPDSYRRSLESIRYQGSTCILLMLNRPLSDYYWINVGDPNSPFVGVIEHTNFISPEKYGGKHLVYLTKYSSSGSKIFNQPHKDIFNHFISYLKQIFSDLRDDDIKKYWVFQDRYSQPVFIKNYSKIMPSATTPKDGIYFLNICQIYPQSRCLNSSIIQAKQLAFQIPEKD